MSNFITLFKIISLELRSVAEALEATDKEFAKYCKELGMELGINTPF